MHSKRCYKVCIRSVVLGELEHESFRNYKGFSNIFLKILDAALRITKNTFFFYSSTITFLHLKILGFLFPTKSSLTWGEMSKTKLQKIAGNLLDKLRKLHMNGRIISKSLAFLK